MAQAATLQNLDAALEAARESAAHEAAEAAAANGDGGEETEHSEDETLQSPVTDPSLANLKDISNLGSWTVSSFKPGCGVEALRDGSTASFWQSDGPQPHLLNIHFFKQVRIVKLRVYLDFELDESYTPTRMQFCAGTHDYDAIEFADWQWHDAGPRGWVDVDLSQCGNERDHAGLADALGIDLDDPALDPHAAHAARTLGVLKCFFLQVRVLENHQNGKDTHIRGVQVFALDGEAKKKATAAGIAAGAPAGVTARAAAAELHDAEARINALTAGMEAADFMGEPVIR